MARNNDLSTGAKLDDNTFAMSQDLFVRFCIEQKLDTAKCLAAIDTTVILSQAYYTRYNEIVVAMREQQQKTVARELPKALASKPAPPAPPAPTPAPPAPPAPKASAKRQTAPPAPVKPAPVKAKRSKR
jgi:hypothetical protein